MSAQHLTLSLDIVAGICWSSRLRVTVLSDPWNVSNHSQLLVQPVIFFSLLMLLHSDVVITGVFRVAHDQPLLLPSSSKL